mgnify:CR=1 FL=1
MQRYMWSSSLDGKRSDFAGFGKSVSCSDKSIEAYLAESCYVGCMRLTVYAPTMKKMREALSRMKNIGVINKIRDEIRHVERVWK